MKTDCSMKLTFSDLINLSLDGDTQTKLIELGAITYEEIEDAQKEYQQFLDGLAADWPPARIAQYLLEKYRAAYKFYKQKKVDIELTNKDARQRGVSYRDRQQYTQQLEALDKLLVQTETKGKQVKKTPQSAHQFVHPLDVEFIHSQGFERHLICATL